MASELIGKSATEIGKNATEGIVMLNYCVEKFFTKKVVDRGGRFKMLLSGKFFSLAPLGFLLAPLTKNPGYASAPVPNYAITLATGPELRGGGGGDTPQKFYSKLQSAGLLF